MNLFIDSGVATDPDYSNVVLLLTGDDLLDSSSFHRTMTNPGAAATVSSAQAYFGSQSVLNSAASSNNCLYAAHSTDFNFGSGDLTIEGLFYFTSLSTSDKGMFGMYVKASPYPVQMYAQAGTGKLAGNVGSTTGTTSFVSASAVFSTNTWYFVQMLHSGGNWDMRVNGSSVVTANTGVGGDINASSGFFISVGNASAQASPMAGHFEQVRITKGLLRATTIPTAPFPTA